MWFLARLELCCMSNVGSRQSLPRQSDRGELEKTAIDFCHFPKCHRITKSRSTSINKFTIHSLAKRILYHCPSLSCLYCLFHCIPMSKTLFSQSELFLPKESRQPRETSEHCLTGPEWCTHHGTWWMHLSLPKASLVAPATEYRRRLDWHLVRDTFRLPSDWGVQDAPAQAVDSDSSVSLSSLTDSSVDTASDSEKILLPEIKEGEESHLPVQPGWKGGQRTAAAGGADGMLITFYFP